MCYMAGTLLLLSICDQLWWGLCPFLFMGEAQWLDPLQWIGMGMCLVWWEFGIEGYAFSALGSCFVGKLHSLWHNLRSKCAFQATNICFGPSGLFYLFLDGLWWSGCIWHAEWLVLLCGLVVQICNWVARRWYEFAPVGSWLYFCCCHLLGRLWVVKIEHLPVC